MVKKIILGLFTGIISGLFSAGGGMIAVPSFVYIFKLNERVARATSIFVILPMVLTSSIFYYNKNHIDWSLGIKCAAGGAIGGVIGAKLLNKLPDWILRVSFSIFLIYVSVRMIM